MGILRLSSRLKCRTTSWQSCCWDRKRVERFFDNSVHHTRIFQPRGGTEELMSASFEASANTQLCTRRRCRIDKMAVTSHPSYEDVAKHPNLKDIILDREKCSLKPKITGSYILNRQRVREKNRLFDTLSPSEWQVKVAEKVNKCLPSPTASKTKRETRSSGNLQRGRVSLIFLAPSARSRAWRWRII